MKTKNILKSLLMSATLLMSGAIVFSCQADKDGHPDFFDAQISVSPENEAANLGDTVRLTVNCNTQWALDIPDNVQRLLVEDAVFTGEAGNNQHVWVKIASDVEDDSWIPGSIIQLDYRAIGYVQGLERTVHAYANIRVGESYADGVHDGSVNDPFSVKEAIEECKKLDNEAVSDQAYYVRGIIKSIKYEFSTQYGTANFNMIDAGGEEEFTAYSVKYLENKSWLEGMKQVAVGDQVVVYGNLTLYNNTPETKSGTCYVYSLNGQTEAEAIEAPAPEYEEITPGEYYMFGKLATNSSGASLEPYIYHAWTGNISSSDLETTSYSYDEGTSTFTVKDGASVYAAKINIEAVSGKENVYYIKYNDQYLYSTEESTNRKMALGNDASNAEWTFSKNAVGGYSANNRSVHLGTANADSKFLRSYGNENTLKYGVELFSTSDVTINNGEGGGATNPEPTEPEEPGKGGVDVLTYSLINESPSKAAYGDWTGRSYESGSGAVYAGNTYLSTNLGYIQLRASDNSGVVSTKTGGKVTKVEVAWNSSTVAGRTLNVYAKTSAYSSAADLYNEDKRGELVGTIAYDDNQSLEITGDYTHIGFCSSKGAMYLDSVTITWEAAE